MAGSKTDYLENKTLDHNLGVAAFTHAATVYVALYTSDPTDTGVAGTEVTGGAYSRQAVTFGAASGGAASNSVAVTFTKATANWGTVTHFGIMDASTAGNMHYHGSLTTPKAINLDDTASFAIGDIDITED